MPSGRVWSARRKGRWPVITDEEFAYLYRRLTLVAALAKHAVFGDEPVASRVPADEFPLLQAAVEQSDADIATVFAELRIYRDMFSSKLEAWKSGRSDDLEQASEPVGGEPVDGVGGEPEEVSADAGDGGADGERTERPDAEANPKRKPKRKKAVDGDGD